jgi:hypothetical protein
MFKPCLNGLNMACGWRDGILAMFKAPSSLEHATRVVPVENEPQSVSNV